MKQERIGITPQDQLRWVIGIVDRRLPRTEADWTNLLHEIQLFVNFAFPAPWGTPFTRLERNLKDIVEWFRSTIDAAVERREINTLPRPEAPVLKWDKTTERYREVENVNNENFVYRIQERLGNLIKTHGHLLKRCEAHAKMRPGRKPRHNIENETVGVCGNLFVAKKITQLYCSSACLNRAITRKKRQGTSHGKKRKRKKM
jgi:hypothetical protein